MNHYYQYARKISLAFLLTILMNLSATSQPTILSAGDIVISGYHSTDNTSDRFSFVLLVNIDAGTVINFTDNGWLIPPTATPAQFRSGEQTVTWTAATALAAGREITISGMPAGAATAVISGSAISPGACTGIMPSISANGDQIMVYQGSSASPTFITALHMNVYNGGGDIVVTTAAAWDATANTTNGSAIPTGLITGTDANWIGTTTVPSSERNNGRFNCTGPLASAAQVRAAVNNQSNWTAEFVGSGTTPSFTLPSGCDFLASIFSLDIISFNGNANNNSGIGLNWRVVNETNDQGHFEIEKSVNGFNFTNIGRVNAQGFSYLPNDYSFADNSVANGANFYRLKIVANNGTIKYSFIIKLLAGLGARGIMISPNPAVSEFTLTTAGGYTQLVIADRNGRTVLQQKLSGNSHRIDVSKLAAGQYSLTVLGASEKITEKLLIAH